MDKLLCVCNFSDDYLPLHKEKTNRICAFSGYSPI